MTELAAYEQIEGPIGNLRDDFYSASLQALIANTARDPKKRKKAFRIKDFWPQWDRGEEQTVEEQQGMFKKLGRFFGAKGS